MCERDGGSTVYEVVELTQEQYKNLDGFDGGLPVPELRADRRNYPYFREWTETRIRESNPEVVRSEEVLKRRSDGKVLARAIRYSRRGGDISTGLTHESSFTCPQGIHLSRQVFKVKGPAG
jgi:hypothetical protein